MQLAPFGATIKHADTSYVGGYSRLTEFAAGGTKQCSVIVGKALVLLAFEFGGAF